ncbi:phytanoyl-CoA dioxygenase family protein [Alisedimentitalea sp. MJ-SS2]|uniref:phytanoyl-CoA dioxygenase family protein n=1 Tax=Aliisedimentitalea sp. MJ-SS2 TaxID=3049795 RepID=UPI00290D8B30|nr:phytanoyl-CoA dioxygenase family protein [Alisedimentitalea sp. MJ-SS2]MDU8927054.1 phytanoyl-CoA dioxygenase family protein [Alisedimentitalea sp. MJ-SS2]
MLSAAQKSFYEENGYLKVERVVTPDQLAELRRLTYDLIDQSRDITVSNDRFELDAGHSRDNPRLTRIKLPHKQHPYFWEILQNSAITEVLTDLLGPDTMIQTSKLNTKAPGGGAAVEWHQDWAFYPHTNDDMLAFGLLLEDMSEENGPLQVIPGTHKGPILSHFSDGVFCGAVHPDDPLFEPDKAVTLTGKAGDMTVHHARTLHGSAPNMSERNRLILFYECHAADAWPLLGAGSYIHSLGQAGLWDDLHDRLVTGKLCLTPRIEQVPVSIPLPPAPDASSIFKSQQSGGAKSAFD